MGVVVALKLGGLAIFPPVVQAPMAGVADQTFRILNRRHGCPLVSGEMISDKALTYGSRETLRMLRVSDEERPTSIQLFGSEPAVMAAATAMIADISSPEVLDINMGCPAQKVVRNREGCALMRDLPLAGRIVREVVRIASVYGIPVTVKMRLGWSHAERAALELARLAQDEGAAAVIVHARTREQLYSGEADWDAIAEVKAVLSIPVVGNGDVRTPQDALRMLQVTGCDAVMVGRAALGNPWVFRRIAHYLDSGELLPEPTIDERLDVALLHARMLADEKGEYTASREMRKHLAWYMRGMRGAAKLRGAVTAVMNLQDVQELLDGCRAYTATEDCRPRGSMLL